MNDGRPAPGLDSLPVQAIDLAMDGEHRDFERARLDSASFASGRVTRPTLQPGWKWSDSVGKSRGVEKCTAPHLGYVIAGAMVVRVADGPEYRYRSGDAYAVSPEPHDAWVDGDETYVAIDVALPGLG